MVVPQLLSAAEPLSRALEDLVVWAETIDLAYAWMDSAGGTAHAWHLLDESKIRRAVIGVHFGGTEPEALEYLYDACSERIGVIEDRTGTFHAKVIVGRRGSERRAILGSSNFTPGGFESNTELNVLVEGVEGDEFFLALDYAMTDYWSRSEPLTPELLDRLRDAWSRRSKPPRRPVIDKRMVAGSPASDTLEVDWAGYVALLGRQRRRHPDLILSSPDMENDGNYLGEARRAREAFERWPNFECMSRESYETARLVAGFGSNAGWFWSTRGNGVWMKKVKEQPQAIGRLIDPIPLCGAVPNQLVLEAFRIADTLPHVAIGCTTRMLCIKRPDLFFPVNAGNKRRMLALLRTYPTDGEMYIETLECVRKFPWYSAPKPSDPYERELWRSRVGLLDVVLYKPRRPAA